jgi:hypothetical protein
MFFLTFVAKLIDHFALISKKYIKIYFMNIEHPHGSISPTFYEQLLHALIPEPALII